jgi:hypothetical protein
VFYAIAKNTTASTLTVNVSGGPYNNLRLSVVDYTNAISPYIDTTSTALTGNSTAITTNGLTPIYAADAMLLVGAMSVTSTFTAGTNFNERVTNSYLFDADFSTVATATGPVFLGKGTSTLTAPFSGTGTLSATADWVSILIGVETPAPAFLAQNDTFEASAGYFKPFQEQYYIGQIFNGGYTGLTWLKNIFSFATPYWATALSTPFSGQIFPTGGNSNGTGQTYPY